MFIFKSTKVFYSLCVLLCLSLTLSVTVSAKTVNAGFKDQTSKTSIIIRAKDASERIIRFAVENNVAINDDSIIQISRKTYIENSKKVNTSFMRVTTRLNNAVQDCSIVSFSEGAQDELIPNDNIMNLLDEQPISSYGFNSPTEKGITVSLTCVYDTYTNLSTKYCRPIGVFYSYTTTGLIPTSIGVTFAVRGELYSSSFSKVNSYYTYQLDASTPNPAKNTVYSKTQELSTSNRILPIAAYGGAAYAMKITASGVNSFFENGFSI